ncbi:MAG: DUF805 domain-containing protein [Pseudomonadota bacterium]
MGPFRSILRVMTHPFTYAGRASFSEYWWFAGLTYLVYFGIVIWFYTSFPFEELASVAALGEEELQAWLYGKFVETGALEWVAAAFTSGLAWVGLAAYVVFSIWHYLAWCAVGARRLHDTGRSAGLYLLIYIWSYLISIGIGVGFGVVATSGPEALAAFAGLLSLINIAMIPLSIIFLVAALWYFICMFFPGDPGKNKFGPPPGREGMSVAAQAEAWVAPEVPRAPAMSTDDLRALRQSRMNG